MNELNFNIFNVIIFAGIIHGFIFSLIILINKNLKSKTSFFLALTILSLAFSNLQYWFIDTGIIPKFRYYDNNLLFIPFEFLMVPFFFLFIKSYLKKAISRKEKIYLFVPFIFTITYLLIIDLLNKNTKVVKILNLIVEYLSILFSIFIIIYVFKIIMKYEKDNSKYNISRVVIKTDWLKRIIYIGLSLCVLWLISLNIFKNQFKEGYYQFYPLWIGISILIYWMGYTTILQKHLLNERKEIRGKILDKPIDDENLINKEASLTFSKIEVSIIKNKLYLNPNISITTLSKKFNLSEGYISQLINKNTNSNFNDFINTLRVNDAKEMLSNPNYNKYTIVAIGLESGFNSKSSFYTAFKKFTGQTPMQYKKDVRNS